jgi:hypothetical protein
MNDASTPTIGEFPRYDIETTTVNKHLSHKIRAKILTGEYTADSWQELQMIRDFKESKLSVDDFLEREEREK